MVNQIKLNASLFTRYITHFHNHYSPVLKDFRSLLNRLRINYLQCILIVWRDEILLFIKIRLSLICSLQVKVYLQTEKFRLKFLRKSVTLRRFYMRCVYRWNFKWNLWLLTLCYMMNDQLSKCIQYIQYSRQGSTDCKIFPTKSLGPSVLGSREQGLGEFLAWIMNSTTNRNAVIKRVAMRNGLILGPCSLKSIRLRPSLTFDFHHADELIYLLRKTLSELWLTF